MPTSAERRKVRGKMARTVGLANARPDDPSLAAKVDHLRAEYRYLSAQDYIRELVDASPPLSDSMRDRLAVLLRKEAV